MHSILKDMLILGDKFSFLMLAVLKPVRHFWLALEEHL